MFTIQKPNWPSSARRHQSAFQRGQSIVVALLVLLLLGLTGALFVTIIARNLINASHANRVQTADNYAAAGITYADAQLSSSIDGADWRPPLQFQLAANYQPTGTRELARYNSQTLATVNPSDPDLEYLQAGYARYNTGAGRFLLRVTYDPVNVNNGSNGVPSIVPPGKYLKIESIGRVGAIDPIDPTTYTNNRSSDRTQAYKVAFKPIGITDYARFETNPDKRSDIANLGVASEFYADNTDGGIATPGVFDFSSTTTSTTTAPPVSEYPILTTYGAADAYIGNGPPFQPNPNAGTHTDIVTGFTPGGGSIHANMPVRFFGANVIYLNLAGANATLFQDTAEIAGNLLLDNYNDSQLLFSKTNTTTAGQQAALILNPTSLSDLTGSTGTDTATYLSPSNSSGTKNPLFDTHGGLVRDGSPQTDTAGQPRSVARLEPPVMNAEDTASQLPRYRAIAMNSAPRTDPASAATPPATYPASASKYGYGKDIYIDNPDDVQPESTTIGGGSTLTDEWLHGNPSGPAGTAKGGWTGYFYNPPGVSIVLGQQIKAAVTTGTTSPAVYGIRFNSTSGTQFPTPTGVANGPTEMDVAYSELDTDASNANTDITDPTGAKADKNIIIYAEGNVRVRGIVSPVEPTGTGTNTQQVPRHITIVTNGTAYIEGNLLKGTPDSSISVLAHDYVCINTTQFLAGANAEDRTDGLQNPAAPDTTNMTILNDSNALLQEFSFGSTGVPLPAKLALYISAGPENPAGGLTTADFSITDTYTAGAPFTLTSPQYSTLTRTTYPLSSFASLAGDLATDVFQLKIQKDAGVNAPVPQNVALERDAVLPMDVRIEAVLYAQTRSFFVIPGLDWFNTDANDNISAYLDSFNSLSGASRIGSTAIDDNRFPLYGQPIDLKITIDGTVSEARPADIAAQTAWMQKWGWIPQYHGSLVMSSSMEQNGHPLSNNAPPPARANLPSIGLQIIYDPQAGYPYDATPAGNGATPYYLRSDQYGRPLPFTPKLPVSTGLLYSGESSEAPLLQ